MVWYPNKCCFVSLKESSEVMDLTVPENTNTHFLMHLVMENNCSEEA